MSEIFIFNLQYKHKVTITLHLCVSGGLKVLLQENLFYQDGKVHMYLTILMNPLHNTDLQKVNEHQSSDNTGSSIGKKKTPEYHLSTGPNIRQRSGNYTLKHGSQFKLGHV